MAFINLNKVPFSQRPFINACTRTWNTRNLFWQHVIQYHRFFFRCAPLCMRGSVNMSAPNHATRTTPTKKKKRTQNRTNVNCIFRFNFNQIMLKIEINRFLVNVRGSRTLPRPSNLLSALSSSHIIIKNHFIIIRNNLSEFTAKHNAHNAQSDGMCGS